MLYDALFLLLDLFDRSINRASIIVSLRFVALETMVVMVLWLLVTCITLDINHLFVIQSVLLSLFILVWLLKYGIELKVENSLNVGLYYTYIWGLLDFPWRLVLEDILI